MSRLAGVETLSMPLRARRDGPNETGMSHNQDSHTAHMRVGGLFATWDQYTYILVNNDCYKAPNIIFVSGTSIVLI